MLLGISVIGWTIVAIVYAPVVLWLLWLGKQWVRSKPAALATVGVIAFLPLLAAVAEAVYVDQRFKALCKEARTEVKRSVVVEGFFDDGFRITGWGDLNRGEPEYRFIEWKDRIGRIWRTERTNEEEKSRTIQLKAPTARYHWRAPQQPTAIDHLIQRREETVLDTMTGETIALDVSFYRSPVLLDRLWLRYFDSFPGSCGTKKQILEVLIGVDRQERK